MRLLTGVCDGRCLISSLFQHSYFFANMQRLGMVIRSLHIYYIVCRVPRFGVRFGAAVYVGGDYVSRVA